MGLLLIIFFDDPFRISIPVCLLLIFIEEMLGFSMIFLNKKQINNILNQKLKRIICIRQIIRTNSKFETTKQRQETLMWICLNIRESIRRFFFNLMACNIIHIFDWLIHINLSTISDHTFWIIHSQFLPPIFLRLIDYLWIKFFPLLRKFLMDWEKRGLIKQIREYLISSLDVRWRRRR